MLYQEGAAGNPVALRCFQRGLVVDGQEGLLVGMKQVRVVQPAFLFSLAGLRAACKTAALLASLTAI
jgi:hypothetical protein